MGYVYLIRNGDLHKIGHTENLARRLKQLQPCTVVQTIRTDRSLNLEKELHSKYKMQRVPQTEYFRLSKEQVEEVRIALGGVVQKQSSKCIDKNTKALAMKMMDMYCKPVSDSTPKEQPMPSKPECSRDSKQKEVTSNLQEYEEKFPDQVLYKLHEKNDIIAGRLTREEKQLIANGAELADIKTLRRRDLSTSELRLIKNGATFADIRSLREQLLTEGEKHMILHGATLEDIKKYRQQKNPLETRTMLQ